MVKQRSVVVVLVLWAPMQILRRIIIFVMFWFGVSLFDFFPFCFFFFLGVTKNIKLTSWWLWGGGYLYRMEKLRLRS